MYYEFRCNNASVYEATLLDDKLVPLIYSAKPRKQIDVQKPDQLNHCDIDSPLHLHVMRIYIKAMKDGIYKMTHVRRERYHTRQK